MKLQNKNNKRIITQSIRDLTGNRMVTELRLVRTDRKGDMLNDYNLQECFNFNPDTGNYTATEVTLNLSLSPNEVYIYQANGSTKTAVDLGYAWTAQQMRWSSKLMAALLVRFILWLNAPT